MRRMRSVLAAALWATAVLATAVPAAGVLPGTGQKASVEVSEDAAEALADQAQLVARLRESGDQVRLVVRGLADPSRTTEQYGRAVPQWSVLLQLVAHMNEHLGQAIAYARMNGVVPPWSR